MKQQPSAAVVQGNPYMVLKLSLQVPTVWKWEPQDRLLIPWFLVGNWGGGGGGGIRYPQNPLKGIGRGI